MKRSVNHRQLLRAEEAARLNLEKLNKQVEDRIRRTIGVLLSWNERLIAANRSKDQFLAAVPHELRTPLGAVTGALRILHLPKITEAKAHRTLEILDRNVAILSGSWMILWTARDLRSGGSAWI